METRTEMLALEIHQHTPITVGDAVYYAVPGDVLVDTAEGRKVMRKRDFDKMIEEGGFELSGDLGNGWVHCLRSA